MKKIILVLLILLISLTSFALDNFQKSKTNMSTTDAERLLISKALYEQGYEKGRIDNLISNMNDKQVNFTFEHIEDLRTGKMDAGELEVWICCAVLLIVVGYLGKDK